MITLRNTFLFPIAAALLAAFVFWSPAVGQDAPPAEPAAPQKITSIEGVTEYRLTNGFRILLYPDQSASKVTVINTVFVGSRYEGYGETGMAHLLEHMNFKGTPTHKEIPKLLSNHGASADATTSFDQTWYYETLAGTDENLEFAICLEADRLMNSLIRREDLASEMTVVRNEFEKDENDPSTILFQRVLATAYEWHNYAKVPIGNLSDIERVSAEPLLTFYRKHYRPDNAMLIVAGKFDEKKALAYADRYFGALKNPTGKLSRTRTEEPSQDGERSVTLRRVGTTGIVMAAYHVPAAAHPDFAPLAVLAQALGSQPQGRLYKALVSAKKSSGIGSFVLEWHDPGLLLATAQVDQGQSTDEVRRGLLDAVETLGTNKLTADEVRDARTELTNGWDSQSSQSIADGLRLWAGCGDWRLMFLMRDRLTKVTAEDVNRVAAKYLVRNNRTVGTYVPSERPERADIPRTPDLAVMLKDFKGGKAIAAGEEFEPTPENIQKRLRNLTLTSGVKAALLPRKTRGETVTLLLSLRYGNEQSLAGLNEASEFLPALMLHGTRGHDNAAINRELVKLDNASIRSHGDPGEMAFAIECKRQHLPEVIKLLGKMLREPTLSKEEFETIKRATVERIREQLKEPGSLAARTLRRKLNPHAKEDLLYVPTLEEAMTRYEAVTVEQVRKLYETQVGGANGELVVVGDFDAEPTVRQVQELLNGWKSSTPYRRIAQTADTLVGGSSEVIDTPDKENAVYRAGYMLAQRSTDLDYLALVVGNYILGQSGGSRLWDRLRGKDGLSYSVQSTYSADQLDAAGGFEFYAICNPANMAKVRAAMAEEIDRLLKDGVTAAELAAAKQAILAHRRTFRDGEIILKLASDLVSGDTLAAYAERSRQIDELTVEQVNAALRKHLQPKKLVIVVAGDFRKAGKQE